MDTRIIAMIRLYFGIPLMNSMMAQIENDNKAVPRSGCFRTKMIGMMLMSREMNKFFQFMGLGNGAR